MPRSTGFPAADAEDDFHRVRRSQVLARLAQRLLREPDDVSSILPFEEVIAALGYAGERDLGVQLISLDSVVGSVDRSGDFDRRFRPKSAVARERWQRIATAHHRGSRRGASRRGDHWHGGGAGEPGGGAPGDG